MAEISRDRLEQLIKSLALSIDILQHAVRDRQRSADEEQSVISLDGIPNTTTIIPIQGKHFRSSNESTGHELLNQISVASQEEKADNNADVVFKFDTLCADLTNQGGLQLDSWRILQYLNWSFYAKTAVFCETMADVVPLSQSLPEVVALFTQNSDLRVSTQKQLYYGLSRWWWENGRSRTVECNPNRGILDMGPWISLMGMRLGQAKHERSRVELTKEVCFQPMEILLQILQMPSVESENPLWLDAQKEGVFWADKLTVGQVLDRNYHYRILEQPMPDDVEKIMSHAWQVLAALAILNIWHFMNYPMSSLGHSAAEIRSTTLSELLQLSYDKDWDDHCDSRAKSDAVVFQCSEFSIEMLQKVGNLTIEWTEYIGSHLELDIENSTVKVFWFGSAAEACPIFYIGCEEYRLTHCHVTASGSHIFSELCDTYSLLFRSRQDTYDMNLDQYGLLPVPHWLRVFHGNDSGTLQERTGKNMSYFLQPGMPRVTDMEYHLAEAKSKLPPTQPFDKYVIWGDRLRQIKAHMENQRPRGIRGLWVDKRDTLQWYTFWAVVFVGTVSLLLSLFGLAVSIAQTVGTFKGLN